MGIHPADRPILEHQDEDSFDAWLKRKSDVMEEPWVFPSEDVEALPVTLPATPPLPVRSQPINRTSCA